jgi:hypothetical protein
MGQNFWPEFSEVKISGGPEIPPQGQNFRPQGQNFRPQAGILP